MDALAPERVPVSPGRRSFDLATLIFAAFPAPLAGVFAAAVLAFDEKEALSLIPLLVVTPGMTLAFSRRRGVGWWASGGFALLTVWVAGWLVGLGLLFMWWEIVNAWHPGH